MLEVQRAAITVLRRFKFTGATHVLAERNEFHLRRYDAAFGVVHLRYGATGLRSKRTPSRAWEWLRAVSLLQQCVFASAFRQISIILGNNIATFVLLHIAARGYPLAPSRPPSDLGEMAPRGSSPSAVRIGERIRSEIHHPGEQRRHLGLVPLRREW